MRKLRRQPSSTKSDFGYLVEGAGDVSGFYKKKEKIYVREDLNAQMRKGRKEWTIRLRDDDNEWVDYFRHGTPKLTPPESGWKSCFDGKVDQDVKVGRTIRKFEADAQGKALPRQASIVKLGEIDAKPPETKQQKRARERMEMKKKKMEERRKAREKKRNLRKSSSAGPSRTSAEEEKKCQPTKSAGSSKKVEEQKVAGAPSEGKVKTSHSNDVLLKLFNELQPRYGKYLTKFRAYGITDLEILKEVDDAGLTDLGVATSMERKVMLKVISRITSGDLQSSSDNVVDQAMYNNEKNEYNKLKLKKKQLEASIRKLEAKEAKLKKEVLELQRLKLQK